MKRLLILLGAICYCVAPDLFVGPADDVLVLLASTVLSTLVAGAKENRDQEYIRVERDY
ncbi:MAG: hypothetical protein IJI20_05605 [Firmicutes bacterium]|nr:hypothetical protein [Bacillota bacterium]